MTCYHPLKAFIKGVNDDGKYDLKVTSYKVDHILKYYNSKSLRLSEDDRSLCPYRFNCREKMCTYQCIPHYWESRDWSDLNWYEFKSRYPNVEKVYTDYFTIPCGQCAGCRIDKSREWANRMMLEMPYSSGSWFVTLTYDDDFLTTTVKTSVDVYDDDCEHVISCWKNPTQFEYEYTDFETGELKTGVSYSLSKKDYQDFVKRLRKEFDVFDYEPLLDSDGNWITDKRNGNPRWKKVLKQSIRLYGCGEYGSEKFRPHYHFIFWNLNLDPDKDLIPYGVSEEGFPYYRCPRLERIWPFGFVTVCNVNWQCCAYVARYVTKKFKWHYKNTYDFFNIEPEFSTMSRKPGLGNQWFVTDGIFSHLTPIFLNLSHSRRI